MSNGIKILLVEDNAADADLTQESLAKSKILHHLTVVRDGVEAMDYLHKRGAYREMARPDLVLLDLNVPRKDGRAVLVEMKADEHLKLIPVVILTSSPAEEDIVKSYELQASAYVQKPVDLLGFAKIIRGIEQFWFTVVKFPPET